MLLKSIKLTNIRSYKSATIHFPKGRVLLSGDIGAGKSSILYSIEFAYKNAKEVVGIDISRNMIEACKKQAIEKQLDEKCTFIQSDLIKYQPPFEFDVSIGIGLFDYIQDPVPVMRKMKQYTRDKVIISFPKLLTWRMPIRKIRLGLKGCNVYFYSKKKIDKLIHKADFDRYEIEKIGNLYCVVAFPISKQT